MPVSLDKDLMIPVNLRKKQLPAVTIFGDNHSDLVKTLWRMVGDQEIRFLNPATREELMAEAQNSALIFVNVYDLSDSNIFLARHLSAMPHVVADVIAITSEQDIRKRLQLMSQEFDAIYNREILDLPEFKFIFSHKLSKGIRRLKARLQEDEYKKFQGFLSVSADAFIVFDEEKRIFFVSDHYLQVYPKSAEFFVRGMPVQKAFEAVAKEMGLSQSDPRYDVVKNFWIGQSGQHEFVIDSGKVLRMTAVPLPDGQGTIISTSDITELTLQKAELNYRRQEAEAALQKEQETSALQKQFISMVSHEFRTPLTIVDGNAQILERRGDRLPPEETKRRLHTIRSAVSRLVNMMEAVLSSSLLRTGKLDLDFEFFDLKSLIEMLCDEQRGLSRDHLITCEVDPSLQNVYLDRKVVTLVLSNLIANAVKYTREEPNIKIKGTVEADEIIIAISDNGVGIPEDELEQIFDRFYRASTSEGIQGTGIGLSLVQELIQLHKGNVSVESTVGKGTSFEVRLPLIQKRGDSHD